MDRVRRESNGEKRVLGCAKDDRKKKKNKNKKQKQRQRQRQKQILGCAKDDRKKSKSKGRSRSSAALRMTERKTKADAKAKVKQVIGANARKC
jgi:hypothetical protein